MHKCKLSSSPSHVFFFLLGLGCTTVVYPQAAAQAAATILGLTDHLIWAKLRARQLNAATALLLADQALQQ